MNADMLNRGTEDPPLSLSLFNNCLGGECPLRPPPPPPPPPPSGSATGYAHLFLIEREYFGFNTLESVVVE